MRMASEKCAAIFFLKIFIILPIVLEARHFQGYNSYKDLYLSRSSGPQLRSMVSSEEIAQKLYYNRNNNGEIKSHIQAASKRKVDKGSKIVFPDEAGMQARNGISDIKDQIVPMPTCTNPNFCENVLNYPTQLVDQALAKNPSLMNYAIRDDADIVAQRMDSNELPLCFSSVDLIYPRMGKNVDQHWKYIVQSDQLNFTQAIRVDICKNEGNACQQVDGFAIGYKTRCKQKFIYRQLSAISNEGNIVRDVFSIPASCCCHLFWDP